MRSRPPGGPDFNLNKYDDPRRALAKWMTTADNPFFARTMANRMWGHFLGRGIIHPIDDARSTNPPSNPELLDALAKDFAASGYNVKHLIRVICNSTAYGLSSIPEDANKNDETNKKAQTGKPEPEAKTPPKRTRQQAGQRSGS